LVIGIPPPFAKWAKCDGFDMELGEFFSSEEFENPNQEIE